MRLYSICRNPDCKHRLTRDYAEAVTWLFWNHQREYVTVYYAVSTGARVRLADERMIRCPRCSWDMKHKTLDPNKVKADPRVRCGSACRAATSDACVCACGGEHHGIAHRIAA